MVSDGEQEMRATRRKIGKEGELESCFEAAANNASQIYERSGSPSILIIGRLSFSIGSRINRNDALNKGSRVNEFLMKFCIDE